MRHRQSAHAKFLAEAQARRDEIKQMLEAGMLHREVAKRVGLSTQRISQIGLKLKADAAREKRKLQAKVKAQEEAKITEEA